MQKGDRVLVVNEVSVFRHLKGRLWGIDFSITPPLLLAVLDCCPDRLMHFGRKELAQIAREPQ